MIIDMHAHLWDEAVEENKSSILAAMERYEISKVYVSGLGVHIPNPEEIARYNRAVADFVAQEHGRIGGLVFVSPEHDNAQDVLKRGIEDMGMEGVKLWISRFCDAPEVNPLAELCIKYNVPLLVHAFYKATGCYENESIGRNVANLAERYPELKIIMAHLGGNCYDGIPAIRDYQNVWVDYSGSIFRADDLHYTLEMIGEDRIMHGTDMPGACVVCHGQAMAIKDEQVREKIFWKNAAKFFDTEFKLGEPYDETRLQRIHRELAVL